MSEVEPLSNIDIQEKIGCNFILYQDMHKVKDIRELLPKTLILYQTARVGHFVCVFENSEGLNFFDPLGFFPDDMLKKVRFKDSSIIHHDYTYLIKLLLDQDRPVIYNEYSLQKAGSNVCGHWCTIRMIYSKLHNDEFYNIFKNIKDKDKIIVKLYNSF